MCNTREGRVMDAERVYDDGEAGGSEGKYLKLMRYSHNNSL